MHISRVTHRSATDVHSALINPTPMHNFNTVAGVIEILFHVLERKSTISLEIYCGFIQFISCLYVLPVIPHQLSSAGYDAQGTVVAIALSCCFGCVLGGLFANLPFIVAPPTSISIFVAIYLQQNNREVEDGKVAVILSGIFFMLLGYRPLGHFIAKLIPLPIQAGTAIGIGMITALAGATEIKMIVSGKFTLLDMGEISVEMVVAIIGIVIVTISLHYQIKGAFCIALLFGTITWWAYSDTWPDVIMGTFAHTPASSDSRVVEPMHHLIFKRTTLAFVFDLVFLNVLALNGLAQSFSDLSKLTREDGSVPRGRWLYIVCGASTMLSGFLGGPPILLSPESAAGIKAGAKTGLSTLVCGLCFGISTFFSPIISRVAPAGTSPLLIIVGVILFQNVGRVEWHVMKDAVPAYCALFFIPFTYSVLLGLTISYGVYILIGLCTGDIFVNASDLFWSYIPIAIATSISKPTSLFTGPADSSRPKKSKDVVLISKPKIRNSALWFQMDMPNADVVVNMGYAEMLDDPRIRHRSAKTMGDGSGSGKYAAGSWPGPGGMEREDSKSELWSYGGNDEVVIAGYDDVIDVNPLRTMSGGTVMQ